MKLTKEKILNFVVSIGAAVVIFGAWAKLTHKSFADTMLTIGLFTECFIFVMYAFVPPKDDAAKGGENPQIKVDTKPIEEFNGLVKKVFKGA
jgi:gliding motility-associated protein GldL